MENSSPTLEKWNAYNQLVNGKFVVHLQGLTIKNDRIHLLMAHIVNAHLIWLERIQHVPNSIGPFEHQTLDLLLPLIAKNTLATEAILKSKSLEEHIVYVNSQGQKFENSIHEILIHLFNHSAYHRGQINQLLVAEGHKAMVSDYIFYNRTPIL
jgi:uncharacterized damage-inducible protein DinB